MSIVDSLKAELNLEGDDSEIRKGFREKLKEIHPDRNDGEFKNEAEKLLYTRLSEAIKELSENQLPVITNSDILALMKSVSTNNTKVDLNESLAKRTETSYASYRSKHTFPKISITAITSVISIIWLFPSQLSDHPILGRYIDVESLYFSVVWLNSLLTAVFFWMRINSNERIQKAFLSNLNTEAYQNNLFNRFISDVNKGGIFTKSDFIDSLMRGNSRYSSYTLSSTMINLLRNNPIIDSEVAQSIADIVFLRAEDKGVIRKVDTKSKSIGDEYTLN